MLLWLCLFINITREWDWHLISFEQYKIVALKIIQAAFTFPNTMWHKHHFLSMWHVVLLCCFVFSLPLSLLPQIMEWDFLLFIWYITGTFEKKVSVFLKQGDTNSEKSDIRSLKLPQIQTTFVTGTQYFSPTQILRLSWMYKVNQCVSCCALNLQR